MKTILALSNVCRHHSWQSIYSYYSYLLSNYIDWYCGRMEFVMCLSMFEYIYIHIIQKCIPSNYDSVLSTWFETRSDSWTEKFLHYMHIFYAMKIPWLQWGGFYLDCDEVGLPWLQWGDLLPWLQWSPSSNNLMITKFQ